MEITASPLELFELGLAVVLSGAVSGLLAGLFGIGGGAVIVPVLYQGLTFLGVDESVRMHVSVATSIGIIVPTALRSFLAHYRRGTVDMQLLRDWVVVVPVGAIVASVVAAYMTGGMLRGTFSVIAFVVGIRLLFNREHWRLGTVLPGGLPRAVVGFLIGFFSTLMGIGGGVLNNTFMTLYGRAMIQAVATSAGVGVLIAVPAVFGYIWAGWDAPHLPPFSAGFINLVGVALVIPVSVIAAPYGVRIAHALSRRALETAFGAFMIFVAVRFAVTLF